MEKNEYKANLAKLYINWLTKHVRIYANVHTLIHNQHTHIHTYAYIHTQHKLYIYITYTYTHMHTHTHTHIVFPLTVLHCIVTLFNESVLNPIILLLN